MSGFVLARAYDERPVAFMFKRVARLWPLYAACMVVGYVGLSGSAPKVGVLVWLPFPKYAMAPAIDPPAWSLYYEAWATPCFPFAFYFFRRLSRVAALTATSTSFLLVLIDARLFCVPFFLAGVTANRFELGLPTLVPKGTLWLGQISYSLYLTHDLVLQAGVRVFGQLGVVVVIPFILPVAWLAWRFIEQPSIAWSRAIGEINLDFQQRGFSEILRRAGRSARSVANKRVTRGPRRVSKRNNP